MGGSDQALLVVGGVALLGAWWYLRQTGPRVDVPAGAVGPTTSARAALSIAANSACVAAAVAQGIPASIAAVTCGGAVGIAGLASRARRGGRRVIKPGRLAGLAAVPEPEGEGFDAAELGRGPCPRCRGGRGSCCDGRAFYEAQMRRGRRWR